MEQAFPAASPLVRPRRKKNSFPFDRPEKLAVGIEEPCSQDEFLLSMNRLFRFPIANFFLVSVSFVLTP